MAWTELRKGLYVGFYRDEAGKKYRAGSDKKKRAALKLAQDQEAKIRGGIWHDPNAAGGLTFSQYFLNHWLPYRNTEIQTRRNYVSHYECELKAAFGDTPLKKLTSAMVQRWVVDMERRSLAPNTIRSRYRTLSTVLGAKTGVSAVRDKLLPTNPCEGVTLPVVAKRKVQKYEVEEIEKVIEALPEWWRPMVLFLVESGVRWGELLGLTVGDFDPEFKGVTVHRTIIRCSKKAAATLGLDQSGFMWKERTKSNEARHVALSPECATAVRRLVRDRGLFGKDRVFSWPAGRGAHKSTTEPMRTEAWPEGHPIHEGRFRTEVWLPAHEAAGIKVRKLHSMRASHICWLLAGGADIVTVQKRVGHGDLATTQLYLDSMADADRRALDALAVTRGRRKAIGD